MPHAALTNGELFKKTVRTTLVMVGSTALWLGALTGAVVLTTGSSAAGTTADSKAEKAAGSTPMAGAAGSPGTNAARPGAPLGAKPARRATPASTKTDPAHPGDPI